MMEQKLLKNKFNSEADIIALFNNSNRENSLNIEMAIGDDGAVICIEKKSRLIVTVDQLIEGVHFLLNPEWARCLGKKLVSISVSDVLSMGGVPRYALLSLSIPGNFCEEFLRDFISGIIEGEKLYNLALIGGDTGGSLKHFSSSMTIIGEAEMERCTYRSGAKAGDKVFVTGFPGLSALGMELIKKKNWKDCKWKDAVMAHLEPRPPFALANTGFCSHVNAMTDISDGLVKDMYSISSSSSVNIVIEEKSLPCHSLLGKYAEKRAIDFVLYGGEDYQLLFTLPDCNVKAVKAIGNANNVSMTAIGEVVEGEGNVYIRADDGLVRKLPNAGHDHIEIFRAKKVK